MTAVVEGQKCPAVGCHWVVFPCTCPESGPSGHLVCAGCGQDADQARPGASAPCDCRPEDQPEPDAGSYRP